MRFDPQTHHRRTIRLHGYDHSQPGAYFITVCTHGKQSLYGEIVEGQRRMNDAGQLVHACWYGLGRRYSGIDLDAFIVMPNHIHGIIQITDVGAIHELPTPGLVANEVGAIHESPLRGMDRKRRRRMQLAKVIGYFKMNTAKQINARRGTPGTALWQRNYYEHIIRNDGELDKICEYISTNPLRWASGRDNPDAVADPEDDPWYV